MLCDDKALSSPPEFSSELAEHPAPNVSEKQKTFEPEVELNRIDSETSEAYSYWSLSSSSMSRS